MSNMGSRGPWLQADELRVGWKRSEGQQAPAAQLRQRWIHLKALHHQVQLQALVACCCCTCCWQAGGCLWLPLSTRPWLPGAPLLSSRSGRGARVCACMSCWVAVVPLEAYSRVGRQACTAAASSTRVGVCSTCRCTCDNEWRRTEGSGLSGSGHRCRQQKRVLCNRKWPG
jgi:hypothetical protein